MDYALAGWILFLISATGNVILGFALHCCLPSQPTTRNGANTDDVAVGEIPVDEAWALAPKIAFETGVLSPFVGPPAPAKVKKGLKKRAKVG